MRPASAWAATARGTVGGNLAAVGGQTGQIPGPLYSDTPVREPAGDGAGRLQPGDLRAVAVRLDANRFLNLEISALEADGKGKVVSSPRVITADQVKALIEQGDEFPYQPRPAAARRRSQFRKATLKLEVTPQITPEGNVIMRRRRQPRTASARSSPACRDRHQARQDAGAGRERRHGRDRRHLRAGRAHRVTKVPFLGDIPYLGNLFKTTTAQSNKTELLIFLTPEGRQRAVAALSDGTRTPRNGRPEGRS